MVSDLGIRLVHDVVMHDGSSSGCSGESVNYGALRNLCGLKLVLRDVLFASELVVVISWVRAGSPSWI